jgi:hypothetical protein
VAGCDLLVAAGRRLISDIDNVAEALVAAEGGTFR